MDASISLTPFPPGAALVNEFAGKSILSLRTPAFVVNRAVVKENCAAMQENARKWGARFRAHVKTHKTAEGVRLQLEPAGSGGAIVVSTLMEAWQVLRCGLIVEGTVKDILYGLPVPVTKLSEIAELRRAIEAEGGTLRLLVDHPVQISKLQSTVGQEGSGSTSPWSVFVKVDPGYRRAGVTPGSGPFLNLLKSIQSARPSAITLYGFYCHAGNSYSSKSLDDASSYLSSEIKSVTEAARLASEFLNKDESQAYVLSVGSTPTAHVSSDALDEVRASVGRNILELHAGNYVFHDLQQLATSLISPSSIAFRVLATVISVYPGRGVNGEDEALVDVGGIGLSKDTGPIEGYGRVVRIFPPVGDVDSLALKREGWLLDQSCGWTLARISQEHGILRKESAESKELQVGSIVALIGQHACLAAAAYPWYYVVDSGHEEEVVDVWVPWKGW